MEIPEKVKQIKILIVDDDGTIIEMCRSILNVNGFNNTSEAENGLIALAKLKKYDFDVVICDWNMPNMDGLELLQQLRRDENLKNIAFLMITSNSDVQSVKQAIRAGVTDYVTKPFEPDILCEKVLTTYAKSLDQRNKQ